MCSYLYNHKKFKIIKRYLVLKQTLILKLRLLGANKTGFNLLIFHFNIHGKLSIIRCDK